MPVPPPSPSAPASPFASLSGPPLAPWPEPSIPALIRSRAARFTSRPAVRYRSASGKWTDLAWSDLDRRRRSIAAGLAALGVQAGDRVLMLSPNSAEMLLAELAILSLGASSAPVFHDYPADLLLHCLRDSGARVALCGSAAHQRRLAGVAGGQLERLVVLDGEPLRGDSRAIGLAELEKLAAARGPAVAQRLLTEVDAATEAVRAGQTAFLLYTSGTTGRPKGVPLSHENVLSQQAAISQVWSLSEDDVVLAYLPWHHCFGGLFERMMALWHGALLVLDDSRGRDLDRLLANFREIRPTLYLSVPRVYQALVARAQADAEAKAALLHPRLRFVFTAAAPLPDNCYRFFESAGVPVHEGWGMTESSPCCTLTGPLWPRTSGACGWPLPGTEVKLVEVEQASAPGVGEVHVRGPQVMPGYHQDVDASRKVLAPGGWLRTGDLGKWTANGLQVLGRLDGVFKLANGEKVSSAEVEARLLAATPLLEQAVVLGVGQTYATALCWLSPGAARRFVEERGLWPEELLERPLWSAPREAAHLGGPRDPGPGGYGTGGFDALAGGLEPEPQPLPLEPPPLAWLTRTLELRRAITEALQAANLLSPVPSERVRRVALVPEPLQLDAGELTPTLKAVRRVVTERHRKLVHALAGDKADPQILELSPAGDPLQHV